MILAGDVGGTKVNLALFKESDNHLEKVEEMTFNSRDYSGLTGIIDEFRRRTSAAVSRAAFGVAGPVKNGKCELTNLGWVVEVRRLQEYFGLDAVWLINDLAAMACAIPFLEESEVEVLQSGSEPAAGRIAMIAAGTGLGEAFLAPVEGGRYLAIESEGGHSDFAPRSDEESRLMIFLAGEFDHVSNERVLSGSGLFNIYRFVRQQPSMREPEWLTRELQEKDPGEVVTRNGLSRKSPACHRALEMFVSIYGAVAGNLALQLLTGGGVYIGGGIAPKIISLIKAGEFMKAFLAKGRFSSFLSEVPVKVILNDKAALTGVAHYALGRKFVQAS